MKANKVTLNKNGTPRKSGSGRKKGSNSFVRISFSQLKDYISEKTPITVSRVWLQDLGIISTEEIKIEKVEPLKAETEVEKEESNKILFKVTKFEEDE